MKARKDVMELLADVEEKDLAKTIKLYIVLTKILIVLLSKPGTTIGSMIVGLTIVCIVGTLTLFTVGMSFIITPIVVSLCFKFFPSMDTTEDCEEARYQLQLYRDIRDGKIEIEKE